MPFEVRNNITTTVRRAITRAQLVFNPIHDLTANLKGAEQKGIQLPEEILPALVGKTSGQLALTLRTWGNRLEKLLYETVAGIMNVLGTIKSSFQNGGSVFAEMDSLLDDTFAKLEDAVQPLQRLLLPRMKHQKSQDGLKMT